MCRVSKAVISKVHWEVPPSSHGVLDGKGLSLSLVKGGGER